MPLFKPKKKTREEVFADLIRNICEKANNSLSNPVTLPSQPTLDDLEIIFKQITFEHFNQAYHYQFSEEDTTPPSIAPGNQILTTFEGFYELKAPQTTNVPTTRSSSDKNFTPIPDKGQFISDITKDLQSQVASLPSWVKQKAQTELATRAVAVFNENSLPGEWTTDMFNPTYEQSDKYQLSIRLDGLFIKVSGTLVESEVRAEFNAIYCVGVYYAVISDATAARQSLWKSLCDAAQRLVQNPISLPPQPSRAQLESILVSYRDNSLFQDDHGFAFQGDNSTPSDLVQELGRPSHLFIVEDDVYSKIEQEVTDSILNKIQLPTWASQIGSEISSRVQTLAQAPSSDKGGWTAVKYDKTVMPASSNEPRVVVKGEFIHCTLISGARQDVTYRAVYFCGVFYKASPMKESVSNDLLQAVYTSALRLIPTNTDPGPNSPSQDDLDRLIFTIVNNKFKDTFDFPYEDGNSSPSDKVGNTIYAGKMAFNSKGRDNAAVKGAVDHIMSSLKIPDGQSALIKSIREDMAAKVQRCLGADPLTVPVNGWDTMSHDRGYPLPNTSARNLSGKAIILYCNASVSGINHVPVQCSFIYFAGVFYEVKPDGGW